MEKFLADHPFLMAVLLLLIGGLLTTLTKKIWETWLSKQARVTPEFCKLAQAGCKEAMLKEFHEFKFQVKLEKVAIETKMKAGDAYFNRIANILEKNNILLEALISINLEFCKLNPKLDCEDLTKLLIKQGVEIRLDTSRRETDEE